MYDADDDGRAGAWERHTMDYIWTGAPYSLYIYRRVRVIIGLVDDVDIFLYGAHTKKGASYIGIMRTAAQLR